MPDRQDTRTDLSRLLSSCSPKMCQSQGQPKQLLEGLAAGTGNKLSFQEYTRNIPGIFNEYTHGPDRGQAAGSGRKNRPRGIYSIPALYPGLCLTSACVSPVFSRDIHFIIFYSFEISLNLLNLLRVQHGEGRTDPRCCVGLEG